jgi:1-deoxy-D-xylulose-5-phosphate reductoisomerase
MKRIAILGSTGSIGTQTLAIAREHQDIDVVALTAGTNIELLETQIREFHPQMVAVSDETAARALKQRVRDQAVVVLSGIDGMLEIASLNGYDILVTAVVGMVGIRPTIAAIEAGKDIAFANKETLVTAGHIIMPLAKKNGVSILPVDSEHSAIFQALQGERQNRIHKILLTASGGPFRGCDRAALGQVTVADALKHPNWSMGKKITIDSATMVNKGLEVMEAKWLFDVKLNQIQVVVHPQSVIHSMVEFDDGAIMAQLGTPDMRLPIQYALYYPNRQTLSGKRLDFYDLTALTFEKPDCDTFGGLSLAYTAMEKGGNMPTAYNAANEKAVAYFLQGRISFLEITEIIQGGMEQCRYIEQPKLADILNTEQETYGWIESRW